MKILLIVYDNDSYIHMFPQGLAYIAAVLINNGYHVEIYSQDMHHYSEEHLTEHLDNNRFDVVGLSFIAGYYQYKKIIKISNAINKAKHRPLFIIGGHGPSPEPGFFLKKLEADIAVIGEGENTILELLNAVSSSRSYRDVKGIAFYEGADLKINERRPLIENLELIPFPAYSIFPMFYYRLQRMPHVKNTDFVMSVLSGRGCPYTCSFCYRMDTGFRTRSNESIIEEIKYLKKDYGITFIDFSDELLMSSEGRVVSLCDDFLKSNIQIKWDCNGRLNIATPCLLALMKRAGCVFINYGIEAMDDNVLKNISKNLTTDQIISGIENTLNAGISPGFNILFGNIGDSEGTLEKAVEFLIKYDDGAQLRTIRPVTPYPGSPLYYQAITIGKLIDCEDFYENRHINSDLLTVNFTGMTDEEYYSCLCEANKKLIQNYLYKKINQVTSQAVNLYFNKDIDFRGFRQI